jgi:hypothetical protein
MPHRVLAISIVCLTVAGCSSGPKLLAAEPRSGGILPGDVVLVDDGSCPAGQVKQVTGGSNRSHNTDIRQSGTARQYACVPRP